MPFAPRRRRQGAPRSRSSTTCGRRCPSPRERDVRPRVHVVDPVVVVERRGPGPVERARPARAQRRARALHPQRGHSPVVGLSACRQATKWCHHRSTLARLGGASVGIALEGVSKRFGKTAAVCDATLAIDEGEFFSLLGPSGCGKTTTLRMIAGFEVPDEGRIVLQGRDVTAIGPSKRPLNMVFQQYALFPHMSVHDNVAFAG